MHEQRNLPVSVCIAVLMALSLLEGCAGKAESAPQAALQSFPVASPERTDTFFEREYVAEIRAVRYAEVRSRIKGILESVNVDEGQTVKAGQTLFSISARDLKQDVLVARAATYGAEAELVAAKLERDNAKFLFEKKVVSETELKIAESKVNTLKAKVDESRANTGRSTIELGFAQLKAPFDGVVNRIPRKDGSAISEDDLLTTVTDTHEVYAYFYISEREYLEYMAKPANERPKKVSLKLADGSIFPSPGEIDTIESEFNKETGSIAFRAKFPNPSGILKHGSTGKVVLEVDLRGAILVPQKSTFEVQGNFYVYTLDADNTVKARKIVPKLRLKDAFVIESGLEPTDRFVVEGVQKIKEGTRIGVLSSDTKSVGG
jgi:membrane fusion protein, multidrug efflux system